jgi:DNA-binding response OmpR family regulator
MSANFHNQQRAKQSGVHEFIGKPFDMDELLVKVASLLKIQK